MNDRDLVQSSDLNQLVKVNEGHLVSRKMLNMFAKNKLTEVSTLENLRNFLANFPSGLKVKVRSRGISNEPKDITSVRLVEEPVMRGEDPNIYLEISTNKGD